MGARYFKQEANPTSVFYVDDVGSLLAGLSLTRISNAQPILRLKFERIMENGGPGHGARSITTWPEGSTPISGWPTGRHHKYMIHTITQYTTDGVETKGDGVFLASYERRWSVHPNPQSQVDYMFAKFTGPSGEFLFEIRSVVHAAKATAEEPGTSNDVTTEATGNDVTEDGPGMAFVLLGEDTEGKQIETEEAEHLGFVTPKLEVIGKDGKHQIFYAEESGPSEYVVKRTASNDPSATNGTSAYPSSGPSDVARVIMNPDSAYLEFLTEDLQSLENLEEIGLLLSLTFYIVVIRRTNVDEF